MNGPPTQACVICQKPLAGRGVASRTCGNPVCRTSYQRQLEARSICLVCGRPLQPHAAIGGPAGDGSGSCRELTCVARFQQVRRMLEGNQIPRCRICGILLRSNAPSADACGDSDCLVLQNAERGRAVQRQREQEYASLVAAAFDVRARNALDAGRTNAADFSPVVVPHQTNGLTTPPPHRVENLKAWLQKIARDVPEPDPAAVGQEIQIDLQLESERPEELAVYRLGCSLCRGACCRNAGDTAYIDNAAMARAQAAAPHRSLAEIQADYLAHLPPQSVENSCLYHGEFGCTLPRQMRGQICNDFLCSGLLRARDLVRRNGVRKLYLIATIGQQLLEGEFLDLDTVPLPAPPRGSERGSNRSQADG